MTKRPIRSDDLYTLNRLDTSALSPDGVFVAYTVETVDRGTEKKFIALYVMNIDTGQTVLRGFEQSRNILPLWTPRGDSLVFLSNREDGVQYQFYRDSLKEDSAVRVSCLEGDIRSPSMSPDGRHILFCYREHTRRQEDTIVCRRITRTFFKSDGEGYLPRARWNICILNMDTGEVRRVTTGTCGDHESPCFSPDGEYVYYLSNPAKDPDFELYERDIYRSDLKTGKGTKIETPSGLKDHLSVSPDGRHLSYIGYTGRGNWWRLKNLITVPLENPEAPVNLTERFDYSVGAVTMNDLGGSQTQRPVWSPDSRFLYYQVSRSGRTTLEKIEPATGKAETVVDEQGAVGYFSLDARGERLVFFMGTWRDPGQLYLLTTDTGKYGPVTAINRDLLDSIEFGAVEEVWFKGSGERDVQGWIAYPPGFDPSGSYPSVLEMHGGPKCQYGFLFMHEFHYLASRGYIVYFCNPSGSLGYGEEHSRAITGHYGTVDHQDVMAFADYVENLPCVDRERMCVTGGSVGGLMTNWIIGHTDRFAAAVAQRSVSNIISQWGSSDGNWGHQYEFGELPPWENFDQYWEQSPMKHIGNARTPTMLIHSDCDARCSPEQAEQVFVALKYLGVDTEMIRFPGEGHDLSRSGRTDRRIARLYHMRRWFDTYTRRNRNEPE